MTASFSSGTDPNLEYNLKKAVEFHGHLCPGTVIGVRMVLLGLEKIKITDPKGAQRKDILVFVENDRCNVDAVQAIAGCRVSSRALKIVDYGKVAATFLNLKTKKAVRIVCPENTRNLVDQYAPAGVTDKKEKAVAAYKQMPLDKLFKVYDVSVELKPGDMPGHVDFTVDCEVCGETVSDHREMIVNGRTLCKGCSGSSYYKIL